MRISHQINLFFEYRMAERLIIKIEKELSNIDKKNDDLWKRKKEKDEKAIIKWKNKKEDILKEWNLKNDFLIGDFPYKKKEEIMKYYNHPSRKNDRNPFIDYYKD